MYLKRVYDHSGDTPVVDHVKVLQASKTQHFTQRFIDRALEEGYLTMSKGQIIVHAKPKDLKYKVVRTPGLFCCFDDERMGSEDEARAYVAKHYTGQESPDENNPAGYRRDNFYACELVE